MKAVLAILVGYFLALEALAQENYVSNLATNLSNNEKLLVTYDLRADEKARSFTVYLVVTQNGTRVSAPSAYGDVGPGILPGNEKVIVWYFKNDFKGNIKDIAVGALAYAEHDPQASFTIDSVSAGGYAPCRVTFSNTSGFANEYQWNFGDPSSGAGNISFEKDPFHVYDKGGIYSVGLTARNSQLGLENTYYQSIEIESYKPTISGFHIEGKSVPPARILFINESVNADVYSWEFGDSTSGKKNFSNATHGKHKYKKAGAYVATLKVKNNFSGLTDQESMEIIIGQQSPIVKYTVARMPDTIPARISFRNESTAAVKYSWDFGDAASGRKNKSRKMHPTHVFSSPGEYIVALSALGKGGSVKGEYSDTIIVKGQIQPPQAKFAIENNNIAGPATIIFINESSDASSFAWDFGDPASGADNTSAKSSPTHTYMKPGRYKVVLTAAGEENQTNVATGYVVIH